MSLLVMALKKLAPSKKKGTKGSDCASSIRLFTVWFPDISPPTCHCIIMQRFSCICESYLCVSPNTAFYHNPRHFCCICCQLKPPYDVTVNNNLIKRGKPYKCFQNVGYGAQFSFSARAKSKASIDFPKIYLQIETSIVFPKRH